MHKQALTLFEQQRKLLQECGLRRIKPRPRPVDGCAGECVHAFGWSCNSFVVVAEERDGAVLDHADDSVHDVGWVGSVADVVAEEDKAFGPHGARVSETGVERLPVAVDVAEQRNEHQRNIGESGHGSTKSQCPHTGTAAPPDA